MHTNAAKKINNFSLKTKLLLSFLMIVVMLVVMIIYATQTVAKKHSKSVLDDNINVSQIVITEHVNDIARVIHKAATNLSSDFTVKSLILNAQNDPASLNVAMNNFSNRFDTSDFAVLSSSGDILAKSTSFSINEIEDRQNLLGEEGAWISMNNSLYLSVMVPVKNTPLSRNSMAYLLFAKPISNIFDENLFILSNLEVAVVAKLADKKEQLVSSTVDIATTQSLFDNKRLIEGDLYASKYDDVAYFGAVKPFVKQNDIALKLMLFTQEEKVFLSYSALLQNIVVLLVVATILVLLFAFFFSEILSRPLLKLSEVATEIGRGEHLVEVPTGNTKEVNRLSAAISKMNSNLMTRNKEVQRLAFEDELCKLPNRTAFYEYVNTKCDKSAIQSLALILIDISKFTDINEAIGYQAGDLLLQAIAERLADTFADELMTIRMAGNQFGILITDDTKCISTIEKVIDCLHAPFCINNLNVVVNKNIGCAKTDVRITDARALSQAADIALKVSKTSYAPYVMFDDSLNLFDAKKLALMSELSHIIQNGCLSLHYQPQLHLADNCIKNVECLARWIHPEHGFVPPDVFISLAEQSGQITEITRFVIREAVNQHCKWRGKGFDIVMAVNISAIDLSDKSFPDFVSDVLRQQNMSTDRLIIEVTESAAMEEPELAIQSLEKLSDIGIKLSIDDFGTGYSSMAQLKKMPVQELKIDKAFVLNMGSDSEDQAMVSTFISLAQNLHLCTVAEGVEDEASLEQLKALNCTYAQGYFISRPMPSDAITNWFETVENMHIKQTQKA